VKIGFAVLLLALGATQALAVTTKVSYATITGTASAPATNQCPTRQLHSRAGFPCRGGQRSRTFL